MNERKPRKQPVIGSSSKFTNVKSVVTKRQVDVFVSRWSPHTTASLRGNRLQVDDVTWDAAACRE